MINKKLEEPGLQGVCRRAGDSRPALPSSSRHVIYPDHGPPSSSLAQATNTEPRSWQQLGIIAILLLDLEGSCGA